MTVFFALNLINAN